MEKRSKIFWLLILSIFGLFLSDVVNVTNSKRSKRNLKSTWRVKRHEVTPEPVVSSREEVTDVTSTSPTNTEACTTASVEPEVIVSSPVETVKSRASQRARIPSQQPANYLHQLPNDILKLIYEDALGRPNKMIKLAELRYISKREAELFSPSRQPFKDYYHFRKIIWTRLGRILLIDPNKWDTNVESLHYLANVLAYMRKAALWKLTYKNVPQGKRPASVVDTFNWIHHNALGDLTHEDLLLPISDLVVQKISGTPKRYMIALTQAMQMDLTFMDTTSSNRTIFFKYRMRDFEPFIKYFFKVLLQGIPLANRPSFQFIFGATSLYLDRYPSSVALTMNAYLMIKNSLAFMQWSLYNNYSSLTQVYSLNSLLRHRSQLLNNNFYSKEFPANLRAVLFKSQLRKISTVTFHLILPVRITGALVRIFDWLFRASNFLKISFMDLLALFDI